MEELRKKFNKEMLELKNEFMAKKSAEKFEYLYDKLIDLGDEKLDADEDWECHCDTGVCDDNKDWIEKIKFEQINHIEETNENINDLYSKIDDLENLVEKILKVSPNLKKKIDLYDKQ